MIAPVPEQVERRERIALAATCGRRMLIIFDRDRRHLRRRFHADRSRRCRDRGDAARRPAAALAGLDRTQASLMQTAETSGHDLHDPARRGGVRRVSRAARSCRTQAAELVAQSGLPPYAIIALLMLFYILLGAVMDELAMILLTLAGLLPDRAGARFRHAAGRGRHLVRHPRADGRRHRADRAADWPQCLRRLGRSRRTCRSTRPIAACSPSSPPTSSGSA